MKASLLQLAILSMALWVCSSAAPSAEAHSEYRSEEPNPCAYTSCPTDTSCEVRKGRAVCVPYHDEETNPCSLVRCRGGTSCEVQNGRAVCVCNTACPFILDELCGSDGKTYSNPCFLSVYNCVNNKNVVMRYSGPCRMTVAGGEHV